VKSKIRKKVKGKDGRKRRAKEEREEKEIDNRSQAF